MKDKLIVFQDKNIRRIWHQDEWYFSVVDVVVALEASSIPKRYWSDLKSKLFEEGFEPYDFIVPLKLKAQDDKFRLTDCANTKSLFRIIQSIPSKKAEPFKMWLAQVGHERIQEIENPEIGQDRIREYYRLKGYSDSWIEKRIRGIAIRQDLTDEWKQRGVEENREFSILTAEISKATFGMTPSEYKEHKNLPTKSNTNLRDHMNDWELIFSMLGEKATTDIAISRDAQGFEENKKASKRGGQIAKNARAELEQETGKTTISKSNYLTESETRSSKATGAQKLKNSYEKKRLK